jgi:hypothetical protein
MKLLILAGSAFAFTLAQPAVSQVSAYADFSASKLTNLVQTSVLYGPTLGITAELTHGRRFRLGGDVRGEIYGTSQRLDAAAVGPRAIVSLGKYEGYGEFLVGFGRYNDGLGNAASATTDSIIEINGGVDRNISSRISWRVFEFGYKQFYGLGGQFNPKTFSSGVVFHITK